MDFIPNVFANPSNFTHEESTSTNDGPFSKMAKEQFEINQLCLRVFKTKDGKKLLDWMKEQTIEASTWDTARSVFEAIPYSFAREGQNAFVRGLIRRMSIAEECKTPEELSNFMRGLND